MTKVIFVTSGKIEYTLPGKDLYESINLSAKGIKFPSVNVEGISEIEEKAKELEKFRPAVIFTTPTSQCLETAKIISKALNISLKNDDSLLPLRFNLKKMITKKEFNTLETKKFDVLRNTFLQAFYNDRLIDSNLEVKRRFESFKKTVEENYKGKTVLAVSHAYIIKLFSIYQKVGMNMYKDQNLLFRLFDPDRETMKRLETLTLDL